MAHTPGSQEEGLNDVQEMIKTEKLYPGAADFGRPRGAQLWLLVSGGAASVGGNGRMAEKESSLGKPLLPLPTPAALPRGQGPGPLIPHQAGPGAVSSPACGGGEDAAGPLGDRGRVWR